MTEYALAPANPTVTPIANVAAMLEAGDLHAYRVRSNGTMRRLALLPLGSTERETAEWISDAIDMDGRSVQSVARELHVSTPTVRRFLESLELTDEIEAGEWDGIWTAHDSDSDAPAELVEDIVDLLDNAPQVADLIEANAKGTDVAPRPARTRRTRTTRSVEEITKAQGLPWPTDAERAAALADVQAPIPTQSAEVPGSQCEPEGTTADELAATLKASIAERVAQEPAKVGGWTMVAKGRSGGVVSCFCGDQGVHAPGAPGCKHVAVPRRTRSHG